MQFTSTVTIDKNQNAITGNGKVYITDIPLAGEVVLNQGTFIYDVPLTEEAIISKELDLLNQQFKLVNLPVEINRIKILANGLHISGNLQLPEVMDSVSAEITDVYITKDEGIDVAAEVVIEKDIKMFKAFTLKNLSLAFDSKEKSFSGDATIKTNMFEASASVIIIESGIESVAIWVTLNHPKPLGNTGLALKGAGGGVAGIQNPPLVLTIGTTLVPVGLPNNTVELDSVSLSYTWGEKLQGFGKFKLFNKSMAEASFSVTMDKFAFEALANFEDIVMGRIGAAIFKNYQTENIDIIGKFSARLQIPDKDGFPYHLIDKILSFKGKSLPYVFGYTENVLYNTELSGRGALKNFGLWNEFRFSYLLEYKNNKIETDFAKNYKLFNQEAFNIDIGARNYNRFLNEPEENRFEGKSLIIAQTGSNARTQQVDQYFKLGQEMASMIVRIQYNNEKPIFGLTDINGNQITPENYNNFGYIDYIEDQVNKKLYYIVGNPIPGLWSINLDNVGNQEILADIIGEYIQNAVFMNNPIQNNNQIDIHWQDGDPNDSSYLQLFYDDDMENGNGVLISDTIPLSDSNNNYQWEAVQLEPGQYYMYAVITQESGEREVIYTGKPIIIEPRFDGPTSLQYEIINDSLKLSWDPVENIYNYHVFYTFKDSISFQSPSTVAGTDNHFTFSWLQPGRKYQMMIVAQDTSFNLSKPSNIISVDYMSETINNAPQISLAEEFKKYNLVGDGLSIKLNTLDQDDDKLTFNNSSIPENSSISNGYFTWTPNSGQVGPHQLKFIVEDSEGLEDSLIVNLNVLTREQMEASFLINRNFVYNPKDSVLIRLTDIDVNQDIDTVTYQDIQIRSTSEQISMKVKETGVDANVYMDHLYIGNNTNKHSIELDVNDTIVIRYQDRTFEDQVIEKMIIYKDTTYRSLAIDNNLLDFGEVHIDSTIEMTLKIYNSGNNDLQIFSIDYPEGFYSNEDLSGFKIAEGDSLSFSVYFTPMIDNNYNEQILIYSNSSSNEVEIVNVKGKTFKVTGISNDFDNDLKIYPNPATHHLIIENLNNHNEIKRIRIISLSGDEILTTTMPKHNNTLNISHLRSGSYILEVLTEKVKIRKLFMTNHH